MTTYLRTLVPAMPGENAVGGTHVYGPAIGVRCDDCGTQTADRCWVPRYGRPCESCGRDA